MSLVNVTLFSFCLLPASPSAFSGIWSLISATSLVPSLSSFSPTSLECVLRVWVCVCACARLEWQLWWCERVSGCVCVTPSGGYSSALNAASHHRFRHN